MGVVTSLFRALKSVVGNPGAMPALRQVPGRPAAGHGRSGGGSLSSPDGASGRRPVHSARLLQVHGEELVVRLEGELAGTLGLCTTAEFDDRTYAGYEGFVGRRLNVVVLGWSDLRGLAVVSRKQAQAQLREELQGRLEVGAVLRAEVWALQPYGAFVDIGGLHAILPVNEISHSFVKHPGELLRHGDSLDVRVIAYDREAGKVRVSAKQVVDPWDQAKGLYANGDTLLGSVTGAREEQVWVRPDPYCGLEILCPSVPGRRYEPGAVVRVRLGTVDPEARKLRGRIIGGVGGSR